MDNMPQTVSPTASSVAYAGFWKRFLAYLIDLVVFMVAFVPVSLLLQERAQALVSLLSLAIPWLYYAAMESSERQATLGKMALGIKVTDVSGARISFGRATGRHFAKILSGMILLIGYFMAGFTAKKQGLHDMLAGTLVVNK